MKVSICVLLRVLGYDEWTKKWGEPNRYTKVFINVQFYIQNLSPPQLLEFFYTNTVIYSIAYKPRVHQTPIPPTIPVKLVMVHPSVKKLIQWNQYSHLQNNKSIQK